MVKNIIKIRIQSKPLGYSIKIKVRTFRTFFIAASFAELKSPNFCTFVSYIPTEVWEAFGILKNNTGQVIQISI